MSGKQADATQDDPAIERWNRMVMQHVLKVPPRISLTLFQREEAYLNYRWTRRTVRTAMLGFIIVPGVLYYVVNRYQVRHYRVLCLMFRPSLSARASTTGSAN